MAVLTVQDSLVTGLVEVNNAAAGGGDSFANNGQVLLRVNNPTGGAITVTVDDPVTPAPAGAAAFNPDVAVAIPAGQARILGPFPPFRFNDAGGMVNLTYSAVGLTVAVIRLRP